MALGSMILPTYGLTLDLEEEFRSLVLSFRRSLSHWEPLWVTLIVENCKFHC